MAPHVAGSDVPPAEEAPLADIEAPSHEVATPLIDHAGPEGEPEHAETPAEQAEPAEHALAEQPATSETASEPDAQFPADAIAALGDLDMALPPRVEVPPQAAEPEQAFEASEASNERSSPQDEAEAAPAAPAPASLATQPVVAPSVTEQQAVLPEPEAPRAGSAIEAGIAGPAAVAGLGAARFGALDLSFDLDLPGTPTPAAHIPAPPLPTFTPEQLAKIARNKLELAGEYIALGDLGGARVLIHEVIESNDALTRDEAHALLATLAPLS
jgi:FimV-like protein